MYTYDAVDQELLINLVELNKLNGILNAEIIKIMDLHVKGIECSGVRRLNKAKKIAVKSKAVFIQKHGNDLRWFPYQYARDNGIPAKLKVIKPKKGVKADPIVLRCRLIDSLMKPTQV